MAERRILSGILAGAVVGVVALTACTSLLGDFKVGADTVADPDGSPPSARKPDGQSCQSAADCASGLCVDAVCCESACSGTCERCDVPGAAGKCSPVPDGQDPDNECLPTPQPDAGVPDAAVELELDAATDAMDGGDAGGDGGASQDAAAGAADSGAVDASASFVVPDGGVAAEQGQCAGKCGGKRACSYPGRDRTCGSVVCGNRSAQGRASCDSQGHCLFGIEPCDAYACPDGAKGCAKACAGEGDCLPTHFCEATTSTCRPKLADGSGCSSLVQCRNAHCVSSVCCNDECSGFPGATCTAAGSVGTCRCTACLTGPCKLYYRDEDSDTFGDKNGTILNGRAVPGCLDGPAPIGFVGNNRDCFDGPNAVHRDVRPDQAGWFAQAYTPPTGGPTFDYNCDDSVQKETPEFIGATCGLCQAGSGFRVDCSMTTTCTSKSQIAGLACGSPFCFPKGSCTPCATITTTGFTTSVNCGDTRTATDCGSCATGTLAGTTFPQVQERCH